MEGDIEILIKQYKQLNLPALVDYDRFNQYAIVHHSVTLEGSTLTEIETRLLLEEGITPGGKPLLHSLMVQDHYTALLSIINAANKREKISSLFIQNINAQVLRQTGNIYQTIFGEIDASKGMFRKGNVSAGDSYFVNFDKVEKLVTDLCKAIHEKINTAADTKAQLNIAFDAHFNLVTIHPFYDGNGRTSRLLMNYIQQLYELPLAIVFKEDKAGYFEALQNTRKLEDINVFRQFMYNQYSKFLQNEIEKYNAMKSPGSKGKGFSLMF